MLAPLLCLLLLPSGEPPATTDWHIEKYEWEGVVKAHHPIEIVNDYGDVRTRLANDQTLAVSGMIQRAPTDPDNMKIKVEQTTEKTVIRVTFPGEVRGAPLRRRIDVTAFIPKQSPLTIRTYRGLIEAKGLESDLLLSTDQGRVVFSTTGTAEVSTRQGDVKGYFKTARWSKPPRFTSVLGNLMLHFPKATDAVVDVATRGKITSDYTMELSFEDASRLKKARVKLGSGKVPVTIDAGRGNVELLRGIH